MCPRYGNTHIVISVPRIDAKVAYQLGRLHKNTFRWTRSTSARLIRINLVMCLFPGLPCGEGRLVREFRADGCTCSVHGMEPATFRDPGDFFGDALRLNGMLL